MKIQNNSQLRYKIGEFIVEVHPRPVHVPPEHEKAVREVAARFPIDLEVIEDAPISKRKQ
jgi:hypothetical protein